MEPRTPSLLVEEHGPTGAPEAVVVLVPASENAEDLARRVARFSRVLVIRCPDGTAADVGLRAQLVRLGVERAHLVLIADPTSSTSTDEVVAYLQQTVSID